MNKPFVLFILVAISLLTTQCGGALAEILPPVATEVPATKAPTATEVPLTEEPMATELPPTEEPPIALNGRSLLDERCAVCHDLGRVEQSKKAEEEWKATVERMVGNGARLDEAEQELLIKYLAETYPK